MIILNLMIESITDLASKVPLFCFCHSGLDPESSVFELVSRFRGNDDFGNNVKHPAHRVGLHR